MMGMGGESHIEKYFVWTVERMGGTAYKFRSPNHRGVADRIACLPDGSVWFVELKADGGRLAPLQALFAARMKALKQNYITLWSKTEIDAWQRTITSSTLTQPNGCET
jgi:streptogramin lyase